MKTTLVFMAAGFGSRFGGGIKQLEPVGPNGEVLMDYAIHDGLKAGFDRVVFIIREDLEREFRAGVGGRTEKKCDVDYAFQRLEDLPEGFCVPDGRKKPWGTGQAILACRNIVHEPFCVLNADDYYGAQAFELMHAYLRQADAQAEKPDCCMIGYVLGNTLSDNGGVTRGICHVDAAGRLEAIREQKGIVRGNGGAMAPGADGTLYSLDLNSPVSMNIWGLPARFFGYLEEGFVPFLRGLSADDLTGEYLIPRVIERMVAENRGTVRVLPSQDKWFGMTYAADRAVTKDCIRSLIERGVYPEKL